MSAKNFQVLEMVGKGSFASVYKVMRKDDGKIYAMKRIKINKMSRKEISDSLNEVRFLASVHHPNIVGFYEAFLENNETELCIIMDFCGCGDLAQKIERYKKRRQYIQEAKIWTYLIQSLRALQVLHRHGICHRDLKAANTFLGEDGLIKIGDMNVSKRLKQGKLQTQIGTPYYMAPEIWNNASYDERCDTWSLGCMIYELAALRPPFLGDSFAALKRAVVIGRYPSLPSTAAPSEALSAVIAMMLRVNATTRPTSTQLLAHPELQRKIIQLGMDSGEGSSVPLAGGPPPSIMNTIKVPMALKRLQEALPKACYPSQLQPAFYNNNSGPETSEPVSSKVPALPVAMLMQQQQQQQQLFSQQPAAVPLPPSVRPRRPLAPLPPPANNQQPQQDNNREQGSQKAAAKAMNPRPPLVPLAQDSENQRPNNVIGGVGSAKELQREAEPTTAAPKVRLNRRIW